MKNTFTVSPEAHKVPEGILNVARNVAHRMGDLVDDWSAKAPGSPVQLIRRMNDAMQNSQLSIEQQHIDLLYAACMKAKQIRSFINPVPVENGPAKSMEITINMISQLDDDAYSPFFIWRVVIDERSVALLCEISGPDGSTLKLQRAGAVA